MLCARSVTTTSTRPQRVARRLEKLRAANYGLVISDWQMEPMTGFDLLKEVRADERLRETPFIIVTAEAQRDNLATARRVGSDECLVKPFDAPTLLSRSRARSPHH